MGLMQGDNQYYDPYSDVVDLKKRVAELEKVVYAMISPEGEIVSLPDDVRHDIHIKETNKRAEILKRIEAKATREKNADVLNKVWKANPDFPLEEQLDFYIPDYLV